MNVSWKKTCATLMQPVKIQMAVMSVLATVDFKEMALPTVQVSFCSSMFHDYVVYSWESDWFLMQYIVCAFFKIAIWSCVVNCELYSLLHVTYSIQVCIYIYIDVNECEYGLDTCHDNATCNDTIGSFYCICDTGFEGDGVNCSSESESVVKTNQFIVDHPYLITVWVPWHFNQFSWTLQLLDVNLLSFLTDINECELEEDLCHPNATCFDTTGSYECACNDGFQGDGITNCSSMFLQKCS